MKAEYFFFEFSSKASTGNQLSIAEALVFYRVRCRAGRTEPLVTS